MKPHPDPDITLLLNTLDKTGIEIRRGAFDGDGGLVKMEDRYILFLRTGVLPHREKELMLDAIRKMGALAVHVPPRVRELLGEDDWESTTGENNG
ncbi:MAG TPA: hypothetical protein VKF42_06425 [Chitinivibrionales bacterium]|jgi:hypothetical protein|nr:hypothetical protein [Chitinivibrionales bacterium]